MCSSRALASTQMGRALTRTSTVLSYPAPCYTMVSAYCTATATTGTTTTGTATPTLQIFHTPPKHKARPTGALSSPALRQAMHGDNPAIHQRYLETSLAKFKDNLPSMEPRQIAHLIRSCGKANKVEEAMNIFDEALAVKKVSQHVVETALNVCFSCNKLELTNDVIAKATAANIEMGAPVLSTLQLGFTEAKDFDTAYEAFLAARAKQLPFDTKDNKLLAGLVQDGNVERAKEIFKAMYETQGQFQFPNDETWTLVAGAAASSNSTKLLLDLIKEVGDETAQSGKFPVAFYTLLICGAVAADPGIGWDLHLQSKYSGIIGSVQHYHLVMVAFFKAKQYSQVLLIYEDMKALGVEPDESTYVIVVSAVVKTPNPNKVYDILNEMRGKSIRPSQQLYQIIFDAFSKAAEFKSSISILEQMRKDGLKPSVQMWTSLMRAMAKAINYERATSHIAKLKESHIENISYKALLNTVSKIRIGEYSFEALDEFKNSTHFDENLKNVMVLMGEEDDGTNMEAILSQMEEAGIKPDETIFNFLMDQAVRRRNLDQVKRIMRKMTDLEIHRSSVTWNIYMRGLGLELNDEAILNVWETKYTPATRSVYDYNTVLHQMARCNRVDAVSRIFNEMNSAKVTPNEITANILMNSYGRYLQLDKCFSVFEAFKKKFGRMSAVAYNVLVACCLMNKRPDRAIEVLDDMHADNIKPLSSFGWDEIMEGIKNISKLEQSWDSVQKQPSGGSAYADLVKMCVECNRPDLVQRVVNMLHQTDTVKWSEIEAELGEKEKSQLDMWQKEERMSFSERDVSSLSRVTTRSRSFRRKPAQTNMSGLPEDDEEVMEQTGGRLPRGEPKEEEEEVIEQTGKVTKKEEGEDEKPQETVKLYL